MYMAGHSNFETTRKFYLGIANDVIEQTRQASDDAAKAIFGTHLARTLEKIEDKKDCEFKSLQNKELKMGPAGIGPATNGL